MIASSGWCVHLWDGGGNYPSWDGCQDGMGKGFLRQLTRTYDNVYEEWMWMRDRKHLVEMPYYLSCILVKCEKSFISLAPHWWTDDNSCI